MGILAFVSRSVILASVAFVSLTFSVATASANVSSSVRYCLAEAIRAGEFASKVRPDGTSDTVVTSVCRGAAAVALYNAVGPYALESEPYQDDLNYTRIDRIFGKDESYSACARFIASPGRRTMDSFICWIRLDLSDDLIKAL